MEQFMVRLGEVSLWSSAVILILLLMGPILSRRYKAYRILSMLPSPGGES